MSAAQELGDRIHLSALEWVPRGGAIAEVDREGPSVLVFGRQAGRQAGSQPGGLRGVYHAPTCVQALVSDVDVRANVLGGRPGIEPGLELFTLPIAGRDPQEAADDVLVRISRYLAGTTS